MKIQYPNTSMKITVWHGLISNGGDLSGADFFRLRKLQAKKVCACHPKDCAHGFLSGFAYFNLDLDG
jgi:hypothetical protein